VTGSGTFKLNGGDDVTGGGTWTTAAADGTVTGTGTYRVTKLVFFELGAPIRAFLTGLPNPVGSAMKSISCVRSDAGQTASVSFG
jgi:hypothetical protein